MNLLSGMSGLKDKYDRALQSLDKNAMHAAKTQVSRHMHLYWSESAGDFVGSQGHKAFYGDSSLKLKTD